MKRDLRDSLTDLLIVVACAALGFVICLAVH